MLLMYILIQLLSSVKRYLEPLEFRTPSVKYCKSARWSLYGLYEDVAILAIIEAVIKLCHVPLKVLHTHLMKTPYQAALK
jgi:hypothetical protein